MARKKSLYLIIGEGLIIIYLIMILYLNYIDPIIIKTKNIESITIVNNLTGTAKQIVGKQDIEEVCNVFSQLNMHKIKNLNSYNKVLGGSSFTFIFYYNNGLNLQIICNDDSYLINNAKMYRIKHTQFENFWELKYEENKYIYPDINKE